MPRRTKKLIGASETLAMEYYCDTDPEAICRAVLAGKLSYQKVYRAMHHFGYRWCPLSRRWHMTYPRWVLNFHDIEPALPQW